MQSYVRMGAPRHGESDEELLSAARSDPAAFGAFYRRLSRIKVIGTDWPAHVELTRPCGSVDGVRIRAFVIVVDVPRGVDVSLRLSNRIRGVEAGR